MEATYAAREDGQYSVSIPVRDSSGAINGAVRLSIDSGIADTRTGEPLEQRLAPVFTCLAAEFERRQAFPLMLREDTQVEKQIELALHAERFELFLQPICSLHDDVAMAHYEVLLRLRTPDGNLVAPKEFLATGGAAAPHAQHRSLGGAHPAGMAHQQPQALGTGAGGVLDQSLGAVDDGRQLHQLRGILREEKRPAAAGAVLRHHRTPCLLGQHQRGRFHEAPGGPGLRSGAG